MHPIAQELNAVLRGSVIDELLSDVGRRIFFPKGIVAQTAEAAKANVRYNATQGIATAEHHPYVLPSVSRHYAELSSEQIAPYAPTGGIPALREEWRRELYTKNPTLPVKISTPVVTAGITHAVAVVAELFGHPASTPLLTPHPYWGNYRLIFRERRDMEIITYPIFASDKRYNIAGLETALQSNSSNTLLCLFNFPHNPTGYTPTTEEIEQLVSTVVAQAERGTRIAILCDDAYFGLQYEQGLMSESLFARFADSHRNILAIKMDGSTKEEFAWGFRVGFLTFASKELESQHYEALDKKLLGVIRATVSNCNRAAQHIILSALQSDTHAAEKQRFAEIIRARYQKVRAVLAAHADHSLITPLPFNSGYFVTLRCHGINTERLRVALLKRGVGIVAIDAEHIRVTYSTLELEDIAPVFEELFESARRIA